MPWSETTPMQERIRFIADLERNLYTNDGAVREARDQP